MKQFLLATLLAATCMTASAETKSYTEKLVVVINGESQPEQEATVTLSDNGDGTYNFVFPNFILGGTIPVGTIEVDKINATQTSGVTKLETSQSITVKKGEPEDAGWLGPNVGPIPIELTGKFNDSHLYCHLNINIMGMAITVNLGEEGNVPEAKTYVEPIQDETGFQYPGTTTFIVTDNGDNTCNILIKDLTVYLSENVPMSVGDVTIKNVTTNKEGGTTTLYTEQQIVIQSPMMLPLDIKLNGSMTDDHLYFQMEIPMFSKVITIGQDPSGIGNISTDTESISTTVYDLQGRKIANPQPGNVYIFRQSNGKTVKSIQK